MKDIVDCWLVVVGCTVLGIGVLGCQLFATPFGGSLLFRCLSPVTSDRFKVDSWFLLKH